MTDTGVENEFSRIFNLDLIKKNGSEVEYSANEEECKKLAERFSIPGVVRLNARCELKKLDEKLIGDYSLYVEMDAEIIQQCVMTLEDVSESIKENFSIIFKRISLSEVNDAQSKEIDFDADEEDIVFIHHKEIDIGEFIAEYLSLSMNPYPRREDIDRNKLGYVLATEDQLNTNPEKKNPFEVLKDLKHKT
ncbi:MAG: DUF177 domain-containing protein [Alphaproteobacteria bacterium]|nr:DUF177 domain-containing protein [Alphaproteobacteria bacterium]HPF46425.1 DUF177 domain-containing protein [Emcibacteraceae bacterium]HRW28925.1 DUF177 domain-containing protein [Emcibacteraceae bacterium]